jgi:hypothetical protein
MHILFFCVVLFQIHFTNRLQNKINNYDKNLLN